MQITSFFINFMFALCSVSEEGNEEDFHKSLDKLKDTDPEFYKFLQENDKDVFQEEEEEEEDSEGEEQPAEVGFDHKQSLPYLVEHAYLFPIYFVYASLHCIYKTS